MVIEKIEYRLILWHIGLEYGKQLKIPLVVNCKLMNQLFIDIIIVEYIAEDILL